MHDRSWIPFARSSRQCNARPRVPPRPSVIVTAALLALGAVVAIFSFTRVQDASALPRRPAPAAVGGIRPEDDLFAVVRDVDRQPLLAQLGRLRQALQELALLGLGD